MQIPMPLLSVVSPPSIGHSEGPGILEVFLQSGPMAKVVLAVLVIFSLLSWATIVAKALQFQRADRQSASFLQIFRKSRRFSEVANSASSLSASPMVGLFQTGHAEIDAQIKHSRAGDEGSSGALRIRSIAALERSLQRAVHVELQAFSRWTPLLATTAAATPFIGLFGTVWGIMVAFQDIGFTGSTSLAVVAPGIAEALVNTAAGLGAAIPALIAYNYFANRLRRLRLRLEDFALEFLNLAERNFT
ncbi:MAG: MotA/TolQ/ExbB proton channel family protein [Acidobacteriota bacterium]